MMIESEIETSARIAQIHEPFEQELRDVADRTNDLHEAHWKQTALETRSYRSGEYWRSIHVERRDWLDADGRIWEVIADAPHARIVEERLEPVPGYLPGDPGPGRFPARLAVERTDREIPQLIEAGLQRAGQQIENG